MTYAAASPPLADADAVARRNALVSQNLGLVKYVWNRFFRSVTLPVGIGEDDVLQWGCLGLLRAAEKYDPSYGTQFSTYAVQWIRQRISRNLCDAAPVRIPCHIQGEEREQARERTRLLSLDLPIESASRATTMHAFVAGDDTPERDLADLRDDLADAMRSLPERWREVLTMRMQGKTLQDVADAMSLTRERVRQLERNAIERLRKLHGERLRVWVE